MDGPSITMPSALVQADSRLCGPPSDAPVWRGARAHAAWAARHGVKYLPSCITHCAHPELGPRHALHPDLYVAPHPVSFHGLKTPAALRFAYDAPATPATRGRRAEKAAPFGSKTLHKAARRPTLKNFLLAT